MSQLIKGNSGDVLTSPSPLVGEGRGEGTSLLNKAKRLRSDMTDTEQQLWYHLRAKRFADYKFKRQVPIQRYIADFVCFDSRLIIEVDGGQHSERQKYDKERDQFFIDQGYKVLRFWNHEVLENEEGVLQVILSALTDTPLPNPLPQGERGQKKSPSLNGGEGEVLL